MSWVTKEMIKEWEKEWIGMPEYEQKDLEPFRVIRVQFETQEDVNAFGRLIGQIITEKTKGVWFPAHKKKQHVTKIYVDWDKG